MDHVFTKLAIVLGIAAIAGIMALRLRQPLLVAFISVGVMTGPAGLDMVGSGQFGLLAEMGISLLLFVVGLKLNPALVRSVGLVATVAGLGQMVVTFGGAYLITSIFFDLSPLASFYIAAALTFSSTIIIVKLLADKREIDSLSGRIALGILIVQDIVVVLLMLVLTAYGNGANGVGLGEEMLWVFLNGVAFLFIVWLLTRYLMPKFLGFFAHHPELLVLFGIAWAIGLAALGIELGFSKEVGAFIAGVSLAATPYRSTLGARLVGLRDFMLLFFFIELGVRIDVVNFMANIGPAAILALFVLFAKPFIAALLIRVMGFTKRTSMISGLSLGQISEFSLILATLGLSLGHIDAETFGIITLVGLITFGLSTYMILYSHQIYNFSGFLPVIFKGRYFPAVEKQMVDGLQGDEMFDVIVFGIGRYGGRIAHELIQRGYTVLGVDFDPLILRKRTLEGMTAIYGDIDDSEIFHSLPLANARWIISTLPSRKQGKMIISQLKRCGYKGRIAVTVHQGRKQEDMLASGADVALLPFRDASKEAVDLILSQPKDA